MGNTPYQYRTNTLLYLLVTCLFAFFLNACAPIQKVIDEREQHQQLEEYRRNLGKGLFERVVAESLDIIEIDDNAPAAEIALYALGEVYAHHDYTDRDYAVSQFYFERLIENFPNSHLSSEAGVYISLFQAIDAREKDVTDQKIELQRTALKEKEVVHVEKPRKQIIENNDFINATASNIQMLNLAGGDKPADKAMYNLGLIYAHLDNPEKDYKKAQAFFYNLIEQFPESEYTEEAGIMLGLLDIIDKIQQIDIELQQKRRKLSRP